MKFRCPRCNQKYESGGDAAGSSFTCSACGLEFAVPAVRAVPAERPEEKRLATHPSGWLCFGEYFFGLLFCVVALGFCFNLVAKGGSPLVPLFLFAAGAVCIAKGLVEQLCTTYVVTTRRVIVESGFLSRARREIRICDVRSVSSTASLWERLAGIGTVAIGTAATAGVEILMRGIPAPEKVMFVINGLRD